MEEELQELCVLQWLDFCARLSDCIFARLLCLFSGYFFFLRHSPAQNLRLMTSRADKKPKDPKKKRKEEKGAEQTLT